MRSGKLRLSHGILSCLNNNKQRGRAATTTRLWNSFLPFNKAAAYPTYALSVGGCFESIAFEAIKYYCAVLNRTTKLSAREISL